MGKQNPKKFPDKRLAGVFLEYLDSQPSTIGVLNLL